MALPKVTVNAPHPTIAYAAEELRRYLEQIGADGAGEIRIGLASGFAEVEAFDVADAEVDDAIDIDVRGGSGHIAGVNPRSVLPGVYRYLSELGCRWVRPGADGEFVPRLESLPDVKLRETASYRHRGICIEGSTGFEHVRDLIDWMPKVGFNAYFTQFREAHTFWDRWYSKGDDPASRNKPISIEDAREYIRRTVTELEKRDMLYHAVGHGWTCEPFGISGMGWEQHEGEPPESVKQYLAELDGERKFWHGVPLNTNLCYGNPEARRIINEEIADYSEKHPEIDIMHFWLADGSNNNCECELCRDARPSDLYVKMLNELDELMTAKGLKTRIVFLIYVDLLWPPEKERIQNPDRFILMFAPITRTYATSFSPSGELPPLPPYERNKLEFPSTVEANVAFLKAWQEGFAGDSFDFDYHLIWDHYLDGGYMRISRILSEDMKNLKSIGLNGLVSCQVQRAFFPTGLPMTVMGKTLWDRSIDYEQLAADYYAAAYGPDWRAVMEYLTKLTELFDYPYLRGEKPKVNPESAESFGRAAKTMDEFRTVIERHVDPSAATLRSATEGSGDCWSKSWDYLRLHGQVYGRLARAFQARADGDDKKAAGIWEEVRAFVFDNTEGLHPAFDIFLFVSVVGGNFRPE
ncbi:MAG: DUF4838 domain-containing protein [Armatimonadota bacterium]|nr:DUF4838 domain-containing protein [Armatimonadota bacterium]